MKEKFLAQIQDDLDNNRLVLPTLPEVALKVQAIVRDPSATSQQITSAVALDPNLSARLIKVANSASVRGNQQISDLSSAVTRLGNTLVNTLVMSMTMMPLFQAKHPGLKKHLYGIWRHSTSVAACAFVISQRTGQLNPDVAMLSGLLHDIGKLPILAKARYWPLLMKSERFLLEVMNKLHHDIGKMVLTHWGMPSDITDVAANHDDLKRDHNGNPDYTDIVQVANLEAISAARGDASFVDWSSLGSLKRLGLPADTRIMEIAAKDVSEVRQMLPSH